MNRGGDHTNREKREELTFHICVLHDVQPEGWLPVAEDVASLLGYRWAEAAWS